MLTMRLSKGQITRRRSQNKTHVVNRYLSSEFCALCVQSLQQSRSLRNVNDTINPIPFENGSRPLSRVFNVRTRKIPEEYGPPGIVL